MINVTDIKLFKRHNFDVYGPIFKIFPSKLVATYPLLLFIMFLKCLGSQERKYSEPRPQSKIHYYDFQYVAQESRKNQIKLKNYFFLNFYPQSYDLAVTFISNWCLTLRNNLTKMFRKFV